MTLRDDLARYFSSLTLGILEWSAADFADDLLASDLIKQIRADAWDQGRESVALDFTRPPDEAGMRQPSKNPYREEAK